jgi:hypothetical protein
MDRNQIRDLFGKVAHLNLIGHNLLADGAVLHKYGQLFDETNWQYDTYALYTQLANEGWVGQKWGLAAAQKDMLGWVESNKDEVAEALIENGHIKGTLPIALQKKLGIIDV